MKENENRKYKLTPQNLTDAEVQKRLDLYSERGDEHQYFAIQKIKKRYLERNNEERNKRAKSDLFFAQGKMKGLPHASHDNIKYARERNDQHFRDGIVEEARSEYRNRQNLSKRFNGGKELENDESKTEKILEKESHTKISHLMTKHKAVANNPSKTKLKDAFKIIKDKGLDRGR